MVIGRISNSAINSGCVYNGHAYYIARPLLDRFGSVNSKAFIVTDDPNFEGNRISDRMMYGTINVYSWICIMPENDFYRFEFNTPGDYSEYINSYGIEVLKEISENPIILPEGADPLDFGYCFSYLYRLNPIVNKDKNKMKKKVQKEYLKMKGVIGDRIYSGFHSYHSHKGETHNSMPVSPGINGYNVGVELEVEIQSDHQRNEFFKVESNWFYLESDGSLGSGGVEIITIPMTPRIAYDEKTWLGLTTHLSDIGATSHDNQRCGLHVHISRTAFGTNNKEIDSTLAKVIHLYENELGGAGYGTNYIKRVMRRSYGTYTTGIKEALNDKQQAVLDIAKEDGLKPFKTGYVDDAFSGVHNSGDRYSSINRTNRSTIEFRQGRGTLKPESIAHTVRFCCEIVSFCRKNKAENITRDKFFEHIRNLKDNTSLKAILC